MQLKRSLIMFLLVSLFLVGCSTADQPETEHGPAEASKADNVQGAEEIVSLAVAFIDDLAAGEYESATQHFDETMTKELPPEQLEALWNQLESQLGPFKGQQYASTEEQDGYRIVLLDGSFEQADVILQVTFDQNNQIAGFFVR